MGFQNQKTFCGTSVVAALAELRSGIAIDEQSGQRGAMPDWGGMGAEAKPEETTHLKLFYDSRSASGVKRIDI